MRVDEGLERKEQLFPDRESMRSVGRRPDVIGPNEMIQRKPEEKKNDQRGECQPAQEGKEKLEPGTIQNSHLMPPICTSELTKACWEHPVKCEKSSRS